MIEVYRAPQPSSSVYNSAGTSPFSSAPGNGMKRQTVDTLRPPLGVPQPLGVTSPASSKTNPKDPDNKAKQAAQQFEAVFINQLLQQLDKTIDRSNSMLNGGHAEDTFRGMMMQELATRIATKPGGSGFGLSDAIYRQIKQQEGRQQSAANAIPANLPTALPVDRQAGLMP